MKKIISICLCFALSLASFAFPAMAAEDDNEDYGIMPAYAYTYDAKSSLIVTSAGKATVTIICSGHSNVDSINAKTSIQKKSGGKWSRINIGMRDNYWYDATFGTNMRTTRTATLGKGTFRSRTVFQVATTSGAREKFTKYSPQITR